LIRFFNSCWNDILLDENLGGVIDYF
jgi:hypothetical protein